MANYYPKNKNNTVNIPNNLRSNTESNLLEFLDEEEFRDEVPTYRSLKEANADNGYVDLSHEIMSQPIMTVEPKQKELFFDLSNDSKEDVAKEIVDSITKSEDEKRAEKKKEWSKLLVSMISREDEYAVCENLSGDVIFECLINTMKNIDEVFTKFTQSPDRHPRHVALLQEVMNDLMEEEKTIEEYKNALKKLG